MLFQKQFERLYRAVDRISEQMEKADAEQRQFLAEELEALRQMCSTIFEMWITFEDKVQEVHDRFDLAPGDDLIVDSTVKPMAEAGSDKSHTGHQPPISLSDLGTLLDTDGGSALFRRGLGYFELLMFEESAREFERMLAIDPDMILARLYLALSCVAKGQYEHAERHLTLTLLTATDPAIRAAVHDAKAQMFAQSGRFHEAICELETVLRIKPEYVDARINLAVCWYVLKDYAKALRHAKSATQRDAKDALAWRILGASLFALGNVKEAHEAYKKAISLAPTEPAIGMELAAILCRLKRPDRARFYYEHALDDPSYALQALAGLAEVALISQDYESAVLLYKKLASLRPMDRRTLERLGWALYGKSRLDEATKVFEDCNKRFGADAMSLSGLARVAVVQGDFALARDLLFQVVRLDRPTARLHGLTELGRLYVQIEQYDRAIRYLQSALALDRGYEDALLYLGIAMRANGVDEQAGMAPSLSKTLFLEDENLESHDTLGIDTSLPVSDTSQSTSIF